MISYDEASKTLTITFDIKPKFVTHFDKKYKVGWPIEKIIESLRTEISVLSLADGTSLLIDFSKLENDQRQLYDLCKPLFEFLLTLQQVTRLKLASGTLDIDRILLSLTQTLITKKPTHHLNTIEFLDATPTKEQIKRLCFSYQMTLSNHYLHDPEPPANFKTAVLFKQDDALDLSNYKKQMAAYLAMHRLNRDDAFANQLFSALIDAIEKEDQKATRAEDKLIGKSYLASRESSSYSFDKSKEKIWIGYDDKCRGSCFTINGIGQYFKSNKLSCDMHAIEKKAGFEMFEGCMRNIDGEVYVYLVTSGAKFIDFICNHNEALWNEVYGIYPELKQAESSCSLYLSPT